MSTLEMVTLLPRSASVRERLEEYSIPEPNSGCWLWLRGVSQEGYGRLRVNGKAQSAHRVSYEEYVGPIPDGLYVCHHCDTPGCINPEHLFVGTNQDNMADRANKGRALGEKNNAAKLSDKDVVEIADLIREGNCFQTEIAARYGVTDKLVSHIKLGLRWAHLTGASKGHPITKRYKHASGQSRDLK